MLDNPYGVTSERLSDKPIEPRLMYSPAQAGGAAFLGGLVAATYLVWANFRVLDNPAAAVKAAWIGAALTLLVFAVAFALPAHTSGLPLGIAQVIVARMVVEKYQMSKPAIVSSDIASFQSNWKVFGLSLLSLIGTLAAIFAIAVVGGAAGLLA